MIVRLLINFVKLIELGNYGWHFEYNEAAECLFFVQGDLIFVDVLTYLWKSEYCGYSKCLKLQHLDFNLFISDRFSVIYFISSMMLERFYMVTNLSIRPT